MMRIMRLNFHFNLCYLRWLHFHGLDRGWLSGWEASSGCWRGRKVNFADREFQDDFLSNVTIVVTFVISLLRWVVFEDDPTYVNFHENIESFQCHCRWFITDLTYQWWRDIRNCYVFRPRLQCCNVAMFFLIIQHMRLILNSFHNKGSLIVSETIIHYSKEVSNAPMPQCSV